MNGTTLDGNWMNHINPVRALLAEPLTSFAHIDRTIDVVCVGCGCPLDIDDFGGWVHLFPVDCPGAHNDFEHFEYPED